MSLLLLLSADDTDTKITPNPSVIYSQPTLFTAVFSCDGLIVLGDIDITDNVLLGLERIPAGINITFAVIKPTRIRLYHYPIIGNMFCSDFIITVNAAPNVTILNYGKIASFVDSATITLSSDIYCTVNYNIFNLETGQTVTNSVSLNLLYEINITCTCILTFTASKNGYTTQEKFFYFKREDINQKSIYSVYEDNLITKNNFSPHFSSFNFGDFQFSSITNSFIAGNHPLYTGPKYTAFNYLFNYSELVSSVYIVRLHYKFIGLSNYANKAVARISHNNEIIESRIDAEGWITNRTPIDGGSVLEFYLSLPGQIYTDAYIEIDAFEILGPKHDDIPYTDFEVTYPQLFETEISIANFFYSSPAPGYTLACTVDGTPPTLTSGNCTEVSYLSDIPFISWTRLFYNNDIYLDIVSKCSYTLPSEFQTPINIDNFSLGPLTTSWYTGQKPWLFTDSGMRSPKVLHGTYTIYSDYIYGLDSRVLEITYIIEPNTTGLFNGELNITVDTANNVPLIPITAGEHIVIFTLGSTGASITITYTSNAYLDITTIDAANQFVFITKISGKTTSNLGIFGPAMPDFEDWSIPGLLPWVTTGLWQTPPIIDLDVYYLISPDLTWGTRDISFVVNCIDGNLEVTLGVTGRPEWGESVYQAYYGEILIDNNVVGTIYNNRLATYTYPVILGMHTFIFRFVRAGEGSREPEYSMHIKEIRFPTLVDGVYDYANTNWIIPTYQENWRWDLASTCITPQIPYGTTLYNTEVNTLAITVPLTAVYSILIDLEAYCTRWNADSYAIVRVYGDWSLGALGELYLDMFTNSGQIVTNFYSDLPEIGIITISVQIVSSVPITVCVGNIHLPIPYINKLNLTPIEDIVSFPIECDIGYAPFIDVVYSVDNAPPSIPYTGPFVIDKPTLIKFKIFRDGVYSEVMTKHYFSTDSNINIPEVFCTLETMNNQLYARLVAIPWSVPLVLFINNKIELYNEQLLPVSIGQILIVGHTTCPEMVSYGRPADPLNGISVDYSSFRPIVIGDGTVPPKPVELTYTILYESYTFIPTVSAITPEGTYHNTCTIVLDSNIGEEILYSIDNQNLDNIYLGSFIITNSCTIYVKTATSLMRVLNYNISNIELMDGVFCTVFKSHYLRVNYTYSCIKISSVDICISTALEEFAIAYADLESTSIQSSYATYKQYVIDNNIYTLFADKELTLPFPFVFSLNISPGNYFSIPDMYAAVYLNDIKSSDYVNDNLSCKFNNLFQSNSSLIIVSDYCLRLCVDVLNTSRTSIITTVWTNIPRNNYLSSSSSNVLLSVDGLNFTKVIKLTSDKLYMRGTLDIDAVYGNNISNISIKLITNEVIDEFTI